MKADAHTVNRADAERFLTALDPSANGWTFQTFDDDKERKEKNLARVLHGTLAEHWDTLQRLNEQGAGIFVTVNETDGKGRTAKNIIRVRALFIDLDGSPLEPVLADAEIPQPHIVVESSPKRWYTYQLVSSMELEDFSSAQKILIARYNSDKSVHDLPSTRNQS
jgi:hypothetical protein